jgi:hypothetical protein
MLERVAQRMTKAWQQRPGCEELVVELREEVNDGDNPRNCIQVVVKDPDFRLGFRVPIVQVDATPIVPYRYPDAGTDEEERPHITIEPAYTDKDVVNIVTGMSRELMACVTAAFSEIAAACGGNPNFDFAQDWDSRGGCRHW